MHKVSSGTLKRFFLICAFIGAIGVFFFLAQLVLPYPRNILRTREGFIPERMVIPYGTTVSFTSAREKYFWPASDPHPTHGLFPEFDPGQAIQTGTPWRIRFNRVGIWPYHDHMEHTIHGVIYVLDTRSFRGLVLSMRQILQDFAPSRLQASDCLMQTSGDIRRCWERFTKSSLQLDGVNKTVTQFTSLLREYPQFQPFCHDMLHIAGESAAQSFLRGSKKLPENADLRMCTYGFYHGMMEYILVKRGDIATAASYCNSFRSLPDGGEVVGSCYHGIGHGTAFAQEGNTRNPWEYLPASVSLCEQFQEPNLSNCISGAANGISSLFSGGEYPFPQELLDQPYAPCIALPTEYRNVCYISLGWMVAHVAKGDLTKALALARNIPASEDSIAQTVANVASSVAQFPQTEDYTNVFPCRLLPMPLNDVCMQGYSEGYFIRNMSAPSADMERGMLVCNDVRLRSNEKRTCFEASVIQAAATWSTLRVTEYCESLSGDNITLCVAAANSEQ